MQFAKRLRPLVARGDVTCSVRFWQKPRVKVGGRYKVGDGEIEVTALTEIRLEDITPALARRSGFAGVIDLLKVAKHGPGENVYLVEFVHHPAETRTAPSGGKTYRSKRTRPHGAESFLGI